MKRTVFKKAKLAAAIALTSSTLAMTGCLVEGDDAESVSNSNTSSAVGNNAENTTAPKGTVSGKVEDTNGQPIEGATVWVGTRSMVTTQAGTYEFEDVAATGVLVVQEELYSQQGVRVVIVPPAGYLGATVEAYPTILIDHGEFSDVSGAGNDVEVSGSTNRLIDGFMAVAGDAVLPIVGEHGATVKGTLHDSVTGEVIKNQTINLELQTVNGNDNDGEADAGEAISYASISYPSVTDANGNFTIEGVPTDSTLNFVVGGYKVDSGESIDTNDEVEPVTVDGGVRVTKIISEDNVSPFVVGIDEAVLDGERAKLHDDVTNLLTVRFSETLNVGAIDANSVKVRDLSEGENGVYLNDITVTIGADDKSIILTKNDSNFTAGHDIDILLLKVDFQDTSMNLLVEDSKVLSIEADAEKGILAEEKHNINYDYGNVNEINDYLSLRVELYRELNDNAEIVTNEAQLLIDDTPQGEVTLLSQGSSVFSDVNMEDNTGGDVSNAVEQLNSSEAQSRIVRLIRAHKNAAKVDEAGRIILKADGTPEKGDITLGVDLNLDDETLVQVDVARVKFTASNASKYAYAVTYNGELVTVDDGSGNSTNIIPVIDTESSPFAEVSGSFIKAEEGTEVVFTLTGVKPGYVVTITSVDDLNYLGASKNITLRDNVPVTTSIQNSYGEDDIETSSTTIGQKYGDGGELANPDAQDLIGVPMLGINTGMLADTFNSPHDAVLDSLYAENELNDDGDAVFTKDDFVYDGTAYGLWSDDAARTIAISFTENLYWEDDAVTEPATTIAGLSNWTIVRDSALNSEGSSINSDIVVFNTDNIFDLANVTGQLQSEIDFTNVIKDEAENVATEAAKAKVVVIDALPPMVTTATYDGDKIVVTFNEPVKLFDNDATDEDTLVTILELVGSTGNVALTRTKKEIDLFNEGAEESRKSLTISLIEEAGEGGFSKLNREILFPASTQYDGGSANKTGHAKLDFSAVQDNYGNTWGDDASVIVTPMFALEDTVGDMVAVEDPDATSFSDGEDDKFEVVYEFSHPVDFDSLDAEDLFTLDSATAIIDANSDDTKVVLSDNNTTVTVTIALTGILAEDDEFGFSNDVVSLWDSSTTVEADDSDQVITAE